MNINREQVVNLLSTILVWLIVYFAPTFPLILSIGFFVVCDMITGIIASNKRGEPFTSRKLRNTIAKFISYGVGVLVAFVIEKQFVNDFPAMKIVSGLIAYIELKSINENIETTTGTNIFKTVLDKIKIKT